MWCVCLIAEDCAVEYYGSLIRRKVGCRDKNCYLWQAGLGGRRHFHLQLLTLLLLMCLQHEVIHRLINLDCDSDICEMRK